MSRAGLCGAFGNVSIKIERTGLFDTLQDPGRKGFRSFGVPTGGWFDAHHARLANDLAGNRLDAPCLEIALASGRFQFCALHLHLFDQERLPLARAALAAHDRPAEAGQRVDQEHGGREQAAGKRRQPTEQWPGRHSPGRTA
jgi:hypothetical protein